jgi:rRNA pseudouridine-1189 N-methylase Emg1 (Nep1/Mra1 family)
MVFNATLALGNVAKICDLLNRPYKESIYIHTSRHTLINLIARHQRLPCR